MSSNEHNSSGAPQMKSPEALDMQQGLGNHVSQPDFKSAEPVEASSLDTATEDDAQRFATLVAQFAIAGHVLLRSTKLEAKAPYYVARWGWERPVKSLDEVEQVLKQVRGTNS